MKVGKGLIRTLNFEVTEKFIEKGAFVFKQEIQNYLVWLDCFSEWRWSKIVMEIVPTERKRPLRTNSLLHIWMVTEF